MRTVLHVPIRHTRVDLGSLADGLPAARRAAHAIDAEWRTLSRAVPFLPLDWPTVRLYQDGLPVCGREADIVAELADRGSANHRLLQRLVGLGATLMGTEDPDLLVAELRLAERVAGGEAVDPAEARDLLQRRDSAIAARIDGTLGPGETGLLFLGAAHDPGAHLPDDIALRPWRQAA